MSSVQPQRASINEQETVAEERSPEFKEIIVKSEEDIDGRPAPHSQKIRQSPQPGKSGRHIGFVVREKRYVSASAIL
ncbi:hypothetical protein ILYODFUR_025227 [Ilyodon furcidens]|uniref:Uncharacterized protein n=1 Tax=Ilyodon furcidens TaxID=33524 RepID=A0ABV0TLG9_9TELE